MTITFEGEREVAIKDLIVSDEFPQRLDRPHVRELATSIAELGCIHPPLARAEPDGSYTVGPGEDRVAAHVLLKRTSLTVRLISCEDAELELLREAENRVRRKESPAELLEMVERLTQERDDLMTVATLATAPVMTDGDSIVDDLELHLGDLIAPGGSLTVEEWTDAMENEAGAVVAARSKGGRPKTERMRAVERVAAQTGRDPETVRKAVEREERRREKASIETWGRLQEPGWLERTLKLRALISGVYDRMKAAAGTLTATKLDMAAEREELRNTARAIRSRRPAAVCAWCKNVDQYVTDCTACKGCGWISEEMLEQVPEVLRDPRKAMVQGQEVVLEWEPLAVYPGADGVPLVPASHEVSERTLEEGVYNPYPMPGETPDWVSADLSDFKERMAAAMVVVAAEDDGPALPDDEPDGPTAEDMGL